MLTIKVGEISAHMYRTIAEIRDSAETEVCLGLRNSDIVVSKDAAISILESLIYTALSSYATGVNDDAGKGYLCNLNKYA
jgi:hypothetical protein|nr:MAG TPA: hypothetical protein [Caudoviricetes sp.]